jgi:hypothetical protein
MSGTETGNVLIQDKVESDSFIWKYKKADRNGRIRYPSEVGNLMKETTEQVVTTAGAIASAQFMTGRVLFSGVGAQGASTLPSALTILTLLNMYYDFTKRTATYTNSNSVANRISSEISVEFSNQSGANVTLAQGTGNTFVGFTSPVTIPNNSVLRLKFVVVTSSPTPAFEVYIDGGNISQYSQNLSPSGTIPGTATFGLSAAAPDQLVVFDTTAQTLGYVTDALMPVNDNLTKLMGWDSDTQTPSKFTNATINAGDVNDNIMGWDTTNSTPSKFAITQAAPQKLFTRTQADGSLIWSAVGDVPSGSATTIPIGINATTGNVERYPTTARGTFWQSATVSPAGDFPDAQTTMMQYDANSGTATGISYAAGIFTVAAGHTYMAVVDYATTTTPTGTSYWSVRYGSPLGGAPTTASPEIYRSNYGVSEGSAVFPIDTAGDNVQDFTTFIVTFTNGSGGAIVPKVGGGGDGIINGVKITRLT